MQTCAARLLFVASYRSMLFATHAVALMHGAHSQYLYCVWAYKILLPQLGCTYSCGCMYIKNCMRWITRLVDRWRVQPTVWINVNRRLLWTSIPWTHIAAIGLPMATSVWASAYKLSLRVISSGLGECRDCSSYVCVYMCVACALLLLQLGLLFKVLSQPLPLRMVMRVMRSLWLCE